jgi:hypothetical protein
MVHNLIKTTNSDNKVKDISEFIDELYFIKIQGTSTMSLRLDLRY